MILYKMIYSINMHTTVYQFWRFVYHHEQSVIDHYARISLYHFVRRSDCTYIIYHGPYLSIYLSLYLSIFLFLSYIFIYLSMYTYVFPPLGLLRPPHPDWPSSTCRKRERRSPAASPSPGTAHPLSTADPALAESVTAARAVREPVTR